jgi:integrase
VLDDAEIRLFWAQIMSPPLLPATGIALRLALLTGLRASEIAGIHHTEITNIHDPEQAAILIPEARVKNKRDFLVPLSPLARQLVLEAQQLAGDGAKYLFPSRHDKGAALDPHTLAKAAARFAEDLANDDNEEVPAGAETWKADPPTPHDLRRTFATRLSALGVAREDRMACLNHKDAGLHAKHYDKYERANEKRAAMNIWATALAAILDQRHQRGPNAAEIKP